MEEDKHIFYTSRWKKIQKKFETFRQEVQKFQKSRLSKPKDTQTPPPVPTKQPGKPEKTLKENPKSKPKVPKERAEKLLTYLLLFAFVVIMGVGIFLTQQNSRSRQTDKELALQKTTIVPTKILITETPSPTPNPYPETTISYENVNWILYSDQSLGYSVKHPDTTTPKDLSDDTNLSYISFRHKENEHETFSTIMVRETTLQEEIDYVKWELSHSLVKLENEEDIVFQNYPGKRLDYVPSKYKEQKSTTFFIINKDNYSYTIGSRPEHIDQILSTFVFTDSSNGRYGCSIDNDCTKYETCSEECVNKEWLESNPPEIAPGAACGIPWKYGCKCINNNCEQGGSP